MTPTVWNRRDPRTPENAVYVGRPTKWGNPFLLGRDGSREMVVSRFREYLRDQPALVAAAKKALKGKHLVCWCAPEQCHAYVWLEIVNTETL